MRSKPYCGILAVTLWVVLVSLSRPAWCLEEPPRNRLVLQLLLEDVADNAWSNLELESVEVPGVYYIEMTEVEGSWGAWGSKQEVYEDGTAWQDDKPLDKSDLRLQYRVNGVWRELVVVAPQGAIGDNWFPFEGHGHDSLGQTFLALEDFDGVGLQTPTWVTNNSGGLLTLYAEADGPKAVSSGGKLSIQWAAIKAR